MLEQSVRIIRSNIPESEVPDRREIGRPRFQKPCEKRGASDV